MSKIYMAGIDGMPGEAFHQVGGENNELRCTDIDLNVSWLSTLDFRDRAAHAVDVDVDAFAQLFLPRGAYQPRGVSR